MGEAHDRAPAPAEGKEVMPRMRVLPPRTYAANHDAEDRLFPSGKAHPAKMSLQLARDLFLRYTLPGQLVLDPFFGRGTSLVGCLLGRDVIGVELESAASGGSPFVEYARENWAHLQAHTLPGLPLGQATILQGDSRHLPLPDATCYVVAGSPPYAESNPDFGPGQERFIAGMEARQGRRYFASMGMLSDRYATNGANLGNLPAGDVAAAIGSPPFADSGPASHDDLYTRGEDPSGQAHNGRFRGGSLVKDTYQAAGNVGTLPAGEVAAAITSPPYADAVNQHPSADNLERRLGRMAAAGVDTGKRVNVGGPHGQHRQRQAYGADACVTSPPDQDARGDWPTPEGAGNVRYGSTPGQIGGLAAGDVAAVVSSPPYADGVQARDRLAAIHRAIAEGRASPEVVARFAGLRAGDAGGDGEAALLAAGGYGAADGQIGNLPLGEVAACISSPPYADVADRNRSQEAYCLAQDPLMKAKYGTGDTARHIDGYGQSAGQIGSLPHHATDSGVVTSPPYVDAYVPEMPSGSLGKLHRATGKAAGTLAAEHTGHTANYSPNPENIGNLAHGTPAAASTSPPYAGSHLEHANDVQRGVPFRAWSERKQEQGYAGEDARNTPPETYSSAMLAVLADCYRVVRPGGVLVLVVGNLVRDGRMIDLAADTIALAVAAGWTPWERWRHEKAQISFWRRLHARKAAAKGIDPAAVTVTHEDVLVFTKGQAPAWEFAALPPTTRAPVSVAASSAPALPPAPSMAPLFTLAGEPEPQEAPTDA